MYIYTEDDDRWMEAERAARERIQDVNDKIQKARIEVASEIFEEIDEALQHEIDLEDKYGRNAWGQGDVSGFQTHAYAEDKLDTLQIALSLLKKKYTEKNDGQK